MNSNRYHFAGIESGNLPTHCERVADYWATLNGSHQYASGRAASQFYKSARAFRAGLAKAGLPDEMIQQAFQSTLQLARLKTGAES